MPSAEFLKLHVIYTAVEIFDKVSSLMVAVYNIAYSSCCCFMMLTIIVCPEHEKDVCE